eukprot:5008522-Lingulodinium_polyedra.AAC.1
MDRAFGSPAVYGGTWCGFYNRLYGESTLGILVEPIADPLMESTAGSVMASRLGCIVDLHGVHARLYKDLHNGYTVDSVVHSTLGQ